MNGMIKALLVLAAIFCIVPAYAACSNDVAGIVTGGACSIKELNRNLEKQNAGQKISLPMAQRNLRPVRMSPSVPKSSGDDCIFGMCLFKNLLNEESATEK